MPVNCLSDRRVAQIHISFRDLHTLYDLPVYASHSEYFAEMVLIPCYRWFRWLVEDHL